MQRKKWVCRQGTDGTTLFIPIEDAGNGPADKPRSHFIQDDTMPPTAHPVDGRVYDSKSAFRRVTKAAGFVEAGNDLMSKSGEIRSPYSKERSEPVSDTIRKTLQGYRREIHG